MAKNDNPVVGNSENPRRDFYKHRPAWLSTPVKVVVGIAILVGLVFAGRAIHHAVKNKPTAQTNTGSTSQTAKKPAAASNPSTNGSSSTGTASGGSGAANQSGSTAATQVPNTGPGDTAALFAISAAIGTGAHYFYQRKKRA